MGSTLKILLDKGYIDQDDIHNNKSRCIVDNFLYSIEQQTEDDVIDILYSSIGVFNMEDEDKLKKLKDNILKTENKIFDPEQLFSQYLILFKNQDLERQFLKKILEQSNAIEKKRIKKVFGIITPIFTDQKETIDLKISDEGINYLEYYTTNNQQQNLDARVYSVSMKELQKLYNLTGDALFKRNIRIGIQDKKVGKELKEEFKKYFLSGVYQSISPENKEQFKQDYSVQEKTYAPEIFWYNHNGINIFIDEDDDSYKASDEVITFNPQKVSVINGAQTLTNVMLASENLYEDLVGFNELNRTKIDEIINSVLSKILVKTVFIKGNETFSKPITWGLNNQIPIQRVDMLANNEEVIELNHILSKEQISILRPGENNDGYNAGLSTLQFVKLYLILKGKPGTSKNFNKQYTNREIKNALKDFKANNNLVSQLSIVLDVDKWWTSEKIIRRGDLFSKYGKNYFQSYVIHELSKNRNELDNFIIDDLENYFINANKIIEYFQNENLELGANDFKSDSLFERIKNKEFNNPVNNFDENKIKNYINQNKKNNYSISNIIRKYYEELGLIEENFRIITVTEKDNKVKESFPLPNSTFEEFYKFDGYPESKTYPEFETSKFREALKKKYTMYALYIDSADENYVHSIKRYSDFTFTLLDNWENCAEKVFNATKNAFIEGDITSLPKISSNLLFHVRPKAVNSSDTFQFSDGSDVTKRTFWVNSSTVKEALDLNRNNVIDK